MDNNRFAVLYDLRDDEAGPQEDSASPIEADHHLANITWIEMPEDDDEDWSYALAGPWFREEDEDEEREWTEYGVFWLPDGEEAQEEDRFAYFGYHDLHAFLPELRQSETAQAERVQRVRGTPAGDRAYSAFQHRILYGIYFMCREFEVMTIRGISGAFRFSSDQDFDFIMAILRRQSERLNDMHNGGAPLTFPNEPPSPVDYDTVQTLQDRINLLEAAQRTLEQDGTIAFAEHGDSIDLDNQERARMDRMIQRWIIDTQWTLDHGDEEPRPHRDRWAIDDAFHDWANEDLETFTITIYPTHRHADEFNEFLAPNPLPLQTSHIAEADLVGDHLDCSICHADYEVGEEWSTLPCAHRFHTECVQLWLNAEYSTRKCPFHCAPPT
jgi:hypothetical protein